MLNYVSIILYVLCVGLIAYLTSRHQTSDSFVIARRGVGLTRLTLALAAGFRDGAGLAAWVALSYYYGLGALWLVVGMAIGLCAVAIIAPRVRHDSEESGYITIGGFLGAKIGTKTQRFSAGIILCGALLIIGAQLYVAGHILGELLGLNFHLAVAITSVIVATYLLSGGYATVTWTDVFEWCVLALIFILPFRFGSLPSFGSLLHTVSSPGIFTILTLLALTSLIIFTSPDAWQRIISSKTANIARKGVLLTVPLYFVLSLGVVLFGLAVKSVMPSVDPSMAFVSLFSPGVLPKVITAAFGTLTFAALLSTIDTQVYLFATTLTRDVFPGRTISSNGGGAGVNRIRAVILASVIVITVLASTVGNLIIYVFGSSSMGTILVPILVVALFARKASGKLDILCTVSMLVATILYVILFAIGAFSNLTFTLLPPLVCAMVLVLFMLVSRVCFIGRID